MITNAWATGSRLILSDVGTGTGRRAAARVLIGSPFESPAPVAPVDPCASKAAALLPLVLRCDERTQARVILGARRAAGEVRPHPRNPTGAAAAASLEPAEAVGLF